MSLVFKEEKLLKTLVQHGVRSGKTASLEMEVDGLPFYNTHSLMIEKLLQEVQWLPLLTALSSVAPVLVLYSLSSHKV